MSAYFPIVKELGPGTYRWCACGKTGTEPFCDDSHGEADRGPVELKLRERKKVAFCTCRKTRNAPYCDGTHVHLKE
ncbi:MAG: CDGSH iron-sulfur domain-containing protein [Nitrospirota bacterium]